MLTRNFLTRTIRSAPPSISAVASLTSTKPTFAPLHILPNINTPLTITRQYAHGHAPAAPKVEKPITSDVVIRVAPLAQAPKRVVDHSTFVIGESIVVWHDVDTFSLNFTREVPVGLADLPRDQWPLAGPDYLQWNTEIYSWALNKVPRPDKDNLERTPSRRIKAFVHKAGGRLYTIYPNGAIGYKFFRSEDDYLDGHRPLPDPNLKRFLSTKIGDKIWIVGTPFVENTTTTGLRLSAWNVDADDKWREIEPVNPGGAPPERDNVLITRVGEKIFVWWSNVDANQDTQLSVFDTATRTWSSPAQSGDHPGKLSKFATTVLSDGKILVTGGATIDAHKERSHFIRPFVYHTHAENKVYLFHPESFKWERVHVEGNFPAVFGHTATLLPRHPVDRVVVIGGTESAANKNGTTTAFVLDRAQLQKKK